MTRDEIAAIVLDASRRSFGQTNCYFVAGRILALLPPRVPTEAMVEAMALAMYERMWGVGMWARSLPTDRTRWQGFARAAWAAGYAAGEER